jgi:transcriptional regulator with XRE-family HTH domain
MIPMGRKRPVDTHIGQRLKEYRQLRGMTVRELADAAHVTPGQISHYEHGRDRISHERVTEFARILRIKSNDLYQPPGSRLRRNHVRWRLANFMAAVIAEAAALMSSRRNAAADKAAADNEATMVAAVAVAVGASAAAASDASAGNHATKTAGHVSDDGRGGKIAHDSPVSATGKDTSAQSTPASANGDHSASPFKPTVDHHAIVDPGIKLDLIPTDHLLQHPADNLLHIPAQPDHGADPVHPHVDGNQSASADDSNAHPGKVPHDPPAPTALSSDVSADDSAQPFKTNLDDHAADDPETNSLSNSNNHPLQQPADNSLHTPSPSNSNNHPLQQPADNSLHTPSPSSSNNHPLQQPADNSLHTPAQHDDNGSPAVTDGAGQVDGIESASPKLADDGSTNSGKLDHHASADPDINDQHPADNSLHTLAQPDDGPHPADPPVDVSELPNFKFANNGSGHLDIGPDGAHTAHSQADVDQSDSFKFANNDSAHPGTVVPHDSPTLTTLPSDSSGTHGPAAPNLNVPGTVMSDAASDQFVFEKGHDKVADVKPDMIETDHAVAEIRHLLHTAHDANAVGALDPNHTTAPHDMTKVQLPYHHGDFHFA